MTRSDDDSWDLAPSVGATATMVAAGRALATEAPDLDARAYRLRWPPMTVVYEIDQPAVIEFKTRTLTDLGAVPTADRRTVSMDLRGDWPAGLRAAGFDPSVPTAWAAEGLLMYLPPDAQRRIVAAVTDLSVPGSSLVADHRSEPVKADMATDEDVQTWRDRGFNLDMADMMFVDEPSHFEEYLAEHGWQVASRSRDQLFTRFDVALPAGADHLMGGLDYVTATLPA